MRANLVTDHSYLVKPSLRIKKSYQSLAIAN